MNYKNLVMNLSSDEYLTFMIETVFDFYKDKSLKMSIFDTKQRLRFISDAELAFHNIDLNNFNSLSEV